MISLANITYQEAAKLLQERIVIMQKMVVYNENVIEACEKEKAKWIEQINEHKMLLQELLNK